jgi:hypothetical protein
MDYIDSLEDEFFSLNGGFESQENKLTNSVNEDEEYANLIPLLLIPLIAAPVVAGGLITKDAIDKGKRKEQQRKDEKQIQQQKQQAQAQIEAKINFSPVVTLNCNELEKELAIANNTLADAYNLTESQSRQWGERKGLIEKRIFTLDCAGKKQATEKAKIEQAVGEQAIRLASEKKATQKKILLYGGIGVGVIAVLVTVILIARAGK